MVWPIPTQTERIAEHVRKDRLTRDLKDVRSKTLWLLDKVPEEFLRRRVHSFYSPIGWHFGHIGRTEEYWVSHKALGRPVIDDHLSFLFADLPENPKDNRVNLPSADEIKGYLEQTRRSSLEDLERTIFDVRNPMLNEGYAWDFALQHECQHQETICEMLQLIQKQMIRDQDGSGPGGDSAGFQRDSDPRRSAEYIAIPGGQFLMGSDAVCVYDNEQMIHPVEVKPFKLASRLVTAAEWLYFIRAGGYEDERLWSPEGWKWRAAEGAACPEYWMLTKGGYIFIGPQGIRTIDPLEPAGSISWYEAEAYLKWAGKRFPTEPEWEYAVSIDFATGHRKKFPWGDDPSVPEEVVHGIGTWGQRPPHPLPTAANGQSKTRNPYPISTVAGNLWEWTSSHFLPYPGFTAFPYDGYSKDHMKGEHRVCRGGSWATAAPILRCTFRNWYVPTYRQGFLGLRCADD